MSEQRSSDLDKYKTSYTAQGILVLGGVFFLIGLGMLFFVAKDEYIDELTQSNSTDGPLYFG